MAPEIETVALAALPADLAPGAARVVAARPAEVLEALAPDALALPAPEAARIARFQRPADRAARRAAHGLLRALLAPLLGRAPRDIALVRDPLGRPALPGAGGIDLNLSHGGGWVAVGIARGGRIGVDVEDGAAVADWGRLAPLFLHPDERAALTPLDPRAALRLWALKEACLKASGEGIATPPASLHLGTADPVRLVHAGHDLTARAHPLPGGAWLAVATAGLSAAPRLLRALG